MWLRQILIEIRQLREEVHIMSTSTTTGLTALTQAVSDLIAAVSTETDNVNTAITAISNAVAELGQSEDPQVQTLAANIEAQVAVGGEHAGTSGGEDHNVLVVEADEALS